MANMVAIIYLFALLKTMVMKIAKIKMTIAVITRMKITYPFLHLDKIKMKTMIKIILYPKK